MKPDNRVTLVCIGPVDPFGNVALVDAERLAELSAFDWLINRKRNGNYAERRELIDGRSQKVTLHQFVFGPVPIGFEIDHRNGNTMDDRRENLRLATTQQNAQNRIKVAGHSSRFKGVSFDKRDDKWRAKAQHPLTRQLVQLGRFDLTPDGEIAAARVYDDYARMWHGEL